MEIKFGKLLLCESLLKALNTRYVKIMYGKTKKEV